MPAYPQFGGTNEVEELDIGQEGSVRYVADEARWIGRVLEGADEVASAKVALPGQNVVFRGVGGFTGKQVTWEGNLKLKDDATLGAVKEDLNGYLHGGLGTPDPAKLKSTKLTNKAETPRVLSENAVMESWRLTGRVLSIQGDANFALLVGLEIRFMCLA